MAWNLPPGVTNADIDRAFASAEPLRCDLCGALNDVDEDQCRQCGAHFKEPDPDEEFWSRADHEYEKDR